ncbi:hypothetical protein WH47_12259 [Habropoda laboriosa]|uniref:Zinc finger protein 512B n=1 Tax=Habropoda laboriosa TaxID=597456 RepID=A0A0L7RAP4_9HYME|nr:hypothetical protein WH47_12259 [Habropoda laboriosa]
MGERETSSGTVSPPFSYLASPAALFSASACLTEVLKLNYEHEVSTIQAKEEIKKYQSEDQSSATTNQHERTFNSSQTDKSAKEENAETFANELQQQFSKQIVQPYVLPLKRKNIEEDESIDDTLKLERVNQNATVEYIPSQEITVQGSSTTTKYIPLHENSSNDLGQSSISEEIPGIESIGDFGQRVRSSSIFRQRSNENRGRFRPRQSLFDDSSSSEDYRKQHGKNFQSYAFKKLNASDDQFNIFSKARLPFTLTKAIESQRILKQKEIEEEYSDRVSTTTSTPVVSVFLGKFSGPIVVPDLPHQKYSHTTISDYTESNEVSKPIPASVEVQKKLEDSYLVTSPLVLNPLQVGVALMNAGQDLNLDNDQSILTKEYSQDESITEQVSDIDNESLLQSDAPDSGNSSFQSDQVSQQEQISEVVAQNSPTQSVEIQKSVEIFHTAPVQEIHYPVEFVPHVQQPLMKQHVQEDYRKSLRGQCKDQRPNQINVYRTNEIVDEGLSSNSQEPSRYEYNVNENDIIYSGSSGQVDQTLTVARPVDNKPIFGVKEQVDSTHYDKIIAKHSEVQGIPETSIKQSDYELPQSSSLITVQPARVIDSLPSLVNVENLQGTQETSQIILAKVTSEPPSELRLLMSTPQPYSAEKSVHLPHSIDMVEKKVPFLVEKVIEKQITIPQPYPVHVPIDRVVEKQIRIPYPVHVEKVIEKKVPFAIQRFIIPLPIHFRLPQPIPVPVEKVVEKPVSIPVSVEKVVEKTVHGIARPYPLEVEKRPYALGTTKLVKSALIYNVQNEGNYQQMIRQNYQAPLGPPYGSDNDQGYYNSTTQFYGPGYLALNRLPVRQPLIHTLPKKFGSYGSQYPHSVTHSLNNNNGNPVLYGRTSVEKDKVKDEYIGPVPRKAQASIGIQSKSLYSSPDLPATLRRTRQEVGNTGSFRQSKMEYGFKPPMVPSVQYDEQTATKVE